MNLMLLMQLMTLTLLGLSGAVCVSVFLALQKPINSLRGYFK